MITVYVYIKDDFFFHDIVSRAKKNIKTALSNEDIDL